MVNNHSPQNVSPRQQLSLERVLSTLGRASSQLPARAPEQGELLKGIQECRALLGGWNRRVLAGMGLASLFPAAASSLAWPQSLRWPLVVDGPRAERWGWYRVSAGSHSPGALVLGTAQRQEGARGRLCQACLWSGELRCPGPAASVVCVTRWLRRPESEPGNGSAMRGWRCRCPGQLG